MRSANPLRSDMLFEPRHRNGVGAPPAYKLLHAGVTATGHMSARRKTPPPPSAKWGQTRLEWFWGQEAAAPQPGGSEEASSGWATFEEALQRHSALRDDAESRRQWQATVHWLEEHGLAPHDQRDAA